MNKRIEIICLILLLFSVLSCTSKVGEVFLWECKDSRLYLNKLDTSWVVPDDNFRYDVYVSLRHQDKFNYDTLMFRVELDKSIDTMLFPLVDTNHYWKGTPHVGAFVVKNVLRTDVMFSKKEEGNDSVKISIMPLSSNALVGIDWLAVEIEPRYE